MRRIFITALLVLPGAAQTEDTAITPPVPVTGFVASGAAEDVYAELRENPLFAKINKDLVGSSIVLRVTHSIEPTPGGKATNVASGLLAAGTLGILPVVTNRDIVVYYEILVNGTVLTTHAYRKNLTRVTSVWSKDRTYGLGDEGRAWVKATVPQFVAAAEHDPKLLALTSEYQYYFGSATH